MVTEEKKTKRISEIVGKIKLKTILGAKISKLPEALRHVTSRQQSLQLLIGYGQIGRQEKREAHGVQFRPIQCRVKMVNSHAATAAYSTTTTRRLLPNHQLLHGTRLTGRARAFRFVGACRVFGRGDTACGGGTGGVLEGLSVLSVRKVAEEAPSPQQSTRLRLNSQKRVKPDKK